jgi:F-type H+-transporting ATPase subunit b
MFELDTGLIFWNSVSFAILVLLMYRWVLPPLLALIREREKVIADSVTAARAAREQAAAQVAAAKQKVTAADETAKKIVDRAVQEGEAVKAQMYGAAKKEADLLLVKAREDFQREKNEVLTGIREQTADLVVAAASRVLKKKVDRAENEALIEECIRGCQR